MRELFDVTADSLERILVRWHGPSDREPTPVPNGHIEVPRPLREWYELASRWSGPLLVQNHLLGPDEVHLQNGWSMPGASTAWSGMPGGPEQALSGQSRFLAAEHGFAGLREHTTKG